MAGIGLDEPGQVLGIPAGDFLLTHFSWIVTQKFELHFVVSTAATVYVNHIDGHVEMTGELGRTPKKRRKLIEKPQPNCMLHIHGSLVGDEYENSRVGVVGDHGLIGQLHGRQVQPPAASPSVEPGVQLLVAKWFVNTHYRHAKRKGNAQHTPFPVPVVAAKQHHAFPGGKMLVENLGIQIDELALKPPCGPIQCRQAFDNDV